MQDIGAQMHGAASRFALTAQNAGVTGDVRPALGALGDVMTGRVFTANGPWLTVDREGATLRGAMPNLLAHRQAEAPYYRALAGHLAEAAGLALDLRDTPDRWEGMADVAVVGERVVLTFAVPGHYDAGLTPKSPRSSREGVDFAADHAGVPADARVHAELVYPHFHGDTVHFGARPAAGPPVLVHYPRGLWGDGAARVSEALDGRIVTIAADDAVQQYAGNSRQVRGGVLVPDGVSAAFVAAIEGLGLRPHRVPLYELFGKAGGGPACATLYLPRSLTVPAEAPFRFSVTREAARRRREAIPDRLTVAPEYFAGKARG
jgi:hypothetical protein